MPSKKANRSSLPWDPFKEGRKPTRRYQHISLFSGAGGTDIGLEYAGFKTVFSNDIEEDAVETYVHNNPEARTHATCGDITKLKLPKIKGAIDLLTAGFPCQPFSNAGSRKGTADPRGKLYVRVMEIVKKYKPKVVMLENVRGITTSKHAGKPVIQIIMTHLKKLGYLTSFKLLDASDHRVGQRRLRLIIVGTRMKSHFIFPKGKPRDQLEIKHVLGAPRHNAPNSNDRVTLSPQTQRVLDMVPVGGSWKDIPVNRLPARFKKIRRQMKRYHAPKFYRKFAKKDICGTMTASFTPENSCIWNPCSNKVMSVRDCARIQSFPDWYEFKGRHVRSMHKQIGNAIPPRLSYELGKQIEKHLKGMRPSLDVSTYVPGTGTVGTSKKTFTY
jgi:DNA (cytosine-5)-methyltransferase 1